MLYPQLEIKAEPPCAILIEFHSVIEFCSRGAVNQNRLHEYFARNSENTFSAGSPLARPLSISSARRTNSESHAVSASASTPWSRDRIRKCANSARSVSLRLASSVRIFSPVALIAGMLALSMVRVKTVFALSKVRGRRPPVAFQLTTVNGGCTTLCRTLWAEPSDCSRALTRLFAKVTASFPTGTFT
jgi:hypothetical protein